MYCSFCAVATLAAATNSKPNKLANNRFIAFS
jgi:hypothetical protein